MASELQLNETKLKEFMRLKPTLEDTAAFFEVSERTVSRYLNEHFDMGFKEFRERYMVHTRMKLVRKAIEMASQGHAVMLIFCLKNICGWTNMDPPKGDKPEGVPQQITLNDEQLKALVRAARGAK